MNKLSAVIGVFFLLAVIVYAVDFTPQGDINLRNVYGLYNASFVRGNVSNFSIYYGDGSYLTGVSSYNFTPDIIAERDARIGNDSLKYNSSNPQQFINVSGEADQVFVANRSSIWSAISDRMIDLISGNNWITVSGTNNKTISFNETRANNTFVNVGEGINRSLVINNPAFCPEGNTFQYGDNQTGRYCKTVNESTLNFSLTNIVAKNVSISDRVCLNIACSSYILNNGTGVLIV